MFSPNELKEKSGKSTGHAVGPGSVCVSVHRRPALQSESALLGLRKPARDMVNPFDLKEQHSLNLLFI